MRRFCIIWLYSFGFYHLTTVSAQAPQNNLVQLDDTYTYDSTLETGIQYSPGWIHFSGDQAQERHLNTLSTTNVAGASLVLFFQGDAISYIGDRDPNHASTYISIDGGDPQDVSSWGSTDFQQVLWSTSGLVPGDHQIILSRSESGGRSDWWMMLDYLQVSYTSNWIPSSIGPGAASVPEGALLIDDGHSHVNYQGSWSAMESNDRSFFFGGLQHTTTTPGDSLTFSFNGTAVWYFSDKRAQNGWVMVSVDGSEGELVDTFLPGSDDRWFSQVLCWGKTGLSDGPHQVKITHSDAQGKYVSLDFFKYRPSSGTSSSSGSSISKGAIIGAATGGGALLIVILLIVSYFIRRSCKTRTAKDEGNAEAIDETADKAGNFTSKPSTLQGVSPGPTLSYQSEPWAPGNPMNTALPLRTSSGTHPNQEWTRQSYAGLPEV